MLDIKRIKENPEAVKAGLRAKEVDCDAQVDRILELDAKRRALILSTETDKAEQNRVSKEIPMKKKAGEDVAPIFKRMAELKAQIAENDKALGDVEAEYRTLMLSLPNLPDPDLKPGGKENNEPLRYYGKPHSFDFEPKHHVDLCTDLGLIDYERGTKLAGSGFWMYRGMGSRLEWALLNYFIDQHLADGYEMVVLPLMLEYRCGDVLDGTIDIINHVPQPKQLELEPDRINQLLGTQIPEADMVEYLRRLEIPVEGRIISVPSWRPDLNLTADIAEEVGRLYGYNEIPTTALRGASTQGGYSTDMLLENQAGSLCRALGYSEVITYSFVSPAVFDQIRLPEDSPLRRTLKIQNPLGEDTSVMRTTALPSMLDILGRNSAYHNKSAKLYELAKVYLPTGSVLPQEPKMLVLGTYGEHETFFTLKGELEAVLTGLRVKKPSYTAVRDNPTYHPGRCAKLTVEGVDVGFLGQLHPLAAQNYGLDGEVYCCEVNFTRLLTLRDPEPTYQPLPRYPAVSRDLSLVCDEGLTVAQVEDCMAKAAGKLLRQIRFFDIYRGKGVPEGKKSMAFSLELRADDRTLTDADSEAVVSKVLAALEESLGVTLR